MKHKLFIFLSIFISFFCINNVNALTVYRDGSPVEYPDLPFDGDFVIGQTCGGNTYLYEIKHDTAFYWYDNNFKNKISFASMYYPSLPNSDINREYLLNNNRWNYVGLNRHGRTGFCSLIASTVPLRTDETFTSYSDVYTAYYGLERPVVLGSFIQNSEQQEVLWNNSTANVLSIYLKFLGEYSDYELSIPDFDYYIYDHTSDSRTKIDYKNYTSVVNGITFDYVFNIPFSYNTNVTLEIYYHDQLVTTYDYDVYLDKLISLYDYKMYDFSIWDYAHISGVNSGKFGLSLSLLDIVDLNVLDVDSGLRIGLSDSSYLDEANSYSDNDYVYWFTYDFSSSNHNLILEVKRKPNSSQLLGGEYIFVSVDSYIHLSSNPPSESTSNVPQNQTGYIDNQGNEHFINNPISIDDSDVSTLKDFFSGFTTHLRSFYQEFSFIGSAISNLIISLPDKMIYTLFFMFALFVLAVIIRIWL